MHYSKEEKTKILEGWRKSGKSISAYVKEQGLVRWTFTKWLKAERTMKNGFVEIPAAILPPEQSQELVIEKGGMKIHIPLAIGSGGLRTIISILGGAA